MQRQAFFKGLARELFVMCEKEKLEGQGKKCFKFPVSELSYVCFFTRESSVSINGQRRPDVPPFPHPFPHLVEVSSFQISWTQIVYPVRGEQIVCSSLFGQRGEKAVNYVAILQRPDWTFIPLSPLI